jgi:hypothetical protein
MLGAFILFNIFYAIFVVKRFDTGPGVTAVPAAIGLPRS